MQKSGLIHWRRILTTAALLALGATSMASGQTESKNRVAERVYELRTYHCAPGRLDALKTRFREHTLRLFEKHGMKNIGYWVPADAPDAQNTLVYMLAHDSREAAAKSWKEFREDPEWTKVRDASEKDGKIVEKVESVYLNAVDFSPLH